MWSKNFARHWTSTDTQRPTMITTYNMSGKLSGCNAVIVFMGGTGMGVDSYMLKYTAIVCTTAYGTVFMT